eukprot:Nk52_evm65s2367 gene=Nk52_evmTU65s2367
MKKIKISSLIGLCFIPVVLASSEIEIIDPSTISEESVPLSPGVLSPVQVPFDNEEDALKAHSAANQNSMSFDTQERDRAQEQKHQPFSSGTRSLPSFNDARWKDLRQCPFSPSYAPRAQATKKMYCDIAFVVDYDVHMKYQRTGKNILAEIKSMVEHVNSAVKAGNTQTVMGGQTYNLEITRFVHPEHGLNSYSYLSKKHTRYLNHLGAMDNLFKQDWDGFVGATGSTKRPCAIAMLLDFSKYYNPEGLGLGGLAQELGGICSGRHPRSYSKSNRFWVSIGDDPKMLTSGHYGHIISHEFGHIAGASHDMTEHLPYGYKYSPHYNDLCKLSKLKDHQKIPASPDYYVMSYNFVTEPNDNSNSDRYSFCSLMSIEAVLRGYIVQSSSKWACQAKTFHCTPNVYLESNGGDSSKKSISSSTIVKAKFFKQDDLTGKDPSKYYQGEVENEESDIEIEDLTYAYFKPNMRISTEFKPSVMKVPISCTTKASIVAANGDVMVELFRTATKNNGKPFTSFECSSHQSNSHSTSGGSLHSTVDIRSASFQSKSSTPSESGQDSCSSLISNKTVSLGINGKSDSASFEVTRTVSPAANNSSLSTLMEEWSTSFVVKGGSPDTQLYISVANECSTMPSISSISVDEVVQGQMILVGSEFDKFSSQRVLSQKGQLTRTFRFRIN